MYCPNEHRHRYLNPADDEFSFNAWDNVDLGEEFISAANQIISSQESSTDTPKCIEDQSQSWNSFYSQHNRNFFKVRNWLHKEIPSLTSPSPPMTVLEIGCGTGSVVFPLLDFLPQESHVFCCDISSTAIDILRQDKSFDPVRCTPFQHDLTDPTAFPRVDLITSIFVLSAIVPQDLRQVVGRLAESLREGGEVFFRDYGLYDMTQLRFKSERCLGKGLYRRGDGTLVHYFTVEEVVGLFEGAGLVRKECFEDRRLILNRRRRLRMYRVWIQGTFYKPIQ